MLDSLILENFKPFGARQEIPLAPITLVDGANSAGKTSILQALLLLKHNLEPEVPAAGDPHLVTDGALVNLGHYRDFVFKHDVTRSCEIGMRLRVTSEFVAPGEWIGPDLEDLDLPDVVGLGI